METVPIRGRWECNCDEDHPVLLGVIDEHGTLEVRVRVKSTMRGKHGYYYFRNGTVTATCRFCGKQHTLDLAACEDQTA